MNLQIRPHYTQFCSEVAAQIAAVIRRRPDAVLGLATGSMTLGVYQELIRMHRQEGLSFAGVRIFNLDEYYPLLHNVPQSYHRFMSESLFAHIHIAPHNCFIPCSESRSLLEIEEDAAYEVKIAECGGLDLRLSTLVAKAPSVLTNRGRSKTRALAW